MQAEITYKNKKFIVDFNNPMDISIPLRTGNTNPNAFGINPPLFEPLRFGNYVASVAEGSSVNCENIFINAHGNGTHTECVGHISNTRITINSVLKQFVFLAQLISVKPTPIGADYWITLDSIQSQLNPQADAIILRTLPNTDAKLTQMYSGNNPAFIQPELCAYLHQNKIKHLLVDLPSVDKEEDGGKVAAHRAFWNYPENPVLDSTITEMIYVPNSITDNLYLLNLQIASLETDASPSKPILYKINDVL